MDGFNKGFTSSTSIKPNSTFQGYDEDGLSEEMAFKLKIADKKRLMSTTVSAASNKAAVPKRNRSAERNETLDDEEQHCLSRSLSFDSKLSRLPVVDSQDDLKNSLSVDSPLQPYDPIKNYLSPRPRFLRYDPDRHRKIFARQEIVTRIRRSASFDAGMPFSEEELESSADRSLGASSQEELVEESEENKEIVDSAVGKGEDEHEDDEEDEFDDYEEDSGWSSNLFLQYLFVMIVLILTTLTISSTNSPTFSSAREAVWGFMDLYSKTQCSIYRAVGFNFSEVGDNAFAPLMLMVGKLRKIEIDYGYEEWDNMGLLASTGEFVEMQDGRTKDVWEDEVEGKGGGSDELEELETAETKELVNQDEVVDELEELETAETKELVNQDEEVKHGWTEEGCDQLEGSESGEVENNEVNQAETWGQKNSEPLQGSQTDESKEVEIEEREDQEEISYQLEPVPISKEIETHALEAERESSGQLLGGDSNRNEEIEIVKMMGEEDDVGKEENNNNGLYEKEIEGIGTTDVLIKLASFDPTFAASIGVVLILTFSSVLYYSKQRKISSPVETGIAHKNPTDIKNLEPFANSASLMRRPVENEVSRESRYIHVPTIEFVFGGGEVTSSLRSFGTKGSNFIDNDAVSSGQRKSSDLELSTGDSLSQGSFTVEKKIVKKQRNKTTEEMLSTVRRSSRIHKRLVMSP